MSLKKRLALRYVRTKFALLSAISKRKAAAKAFDLFCTPQFRNRKPLPPIFLEAEKLKFKQDGNTIHGFRWNHPAPKKVLILHGFESTVINFERYIKSLAKEGFEVLAFDAPAHGQSTGKTVNVVQYRDMVQHIVKEYGPITNFIAHSFGGLCISLFLEETRHDDSWRVALIAPATETSTAADQFFRLVKLDEETRRYFDERILQIGGQPPSWYSVSRAAAHIKATVLFLQDKEDEMTPYHDVLPIMKKNYPNFHFLISKGLGHRRIYRDAANQKAITAFIAKGIVPSNA